MTVDALGSSVVQGRARGLIEACGFELSGVCLPDDPEGNAKLMLSILDCLPRANRVSARLLAFKRYNRIQPIPSTGNAGLLVGSSVAGGVRIGAEQDVRPGSGHGYGPTVDAALVQCRPERRDRSRTTDRSAQVSAADLAAATARPRHWYFR